MQCPSCRFENMPGLESCGRCGTLLSLGSIAIDVNPPRASRASKRLRKAVPRHLIYRVRDLASEARRVITRSTVEDSRIPLPEPEILARLIVPGWAHIHSGLVIRGRFFLAAYLPLLLLGLARWGTGLGSMLLGLAFSVHAASVVDILVRQGTVRFPRMMLTTLVVYIILAILVYWPAGQLLSRIAAVDYYQYDAPPFAQYDVVLINRWAYTLSAPRRGDIVQFRPVTQMRQRVGEQALHVRYILEEDAVIDRVVGLAGDRVVWDEGRLSINGSVVSWKPLVPERLPKHLDVTVPKGCSMILPTASLAAANAVGGEIFWNTTSMIPEEQILGRAYLRVSPLSRFWLMY
ncbi:MAG: S26 family signal peptidase [Isosphaeraceae bacterium]